MRRYRLLHIVMIAAIGCLMQGKAPAGPLSEACGGNESLVVAPLPEAVAKAVPAAGKTAAREAINAPGDASPSDSGERTRLVSYLILRGLQGAGPFLGAR